MKKRILFVCLGNICRSPAGEELLRHELQRRGMDRDIEVDSAGTYGGHGGDLPDRRMRMAAQKRGYDLRHRARKVCSDDFELFDMIIAMDDENYQRLRELAPSADALERLYRMADFIDDPDITYVPDPYYEGAEGFEIVLDMLERGCRAIADRLAEQ